MAANLEKVEINEGTKEKKEDGKQSHGGSNATNDSACQQVSDDQQPLDQEKQNADSSKGAVKNESSTPSSNYQINMFGGMAVIGDGTVINYKDGRSTFSTNSGVVKRTSNVDGVTECMKDLAVSDDEDDDSSYTSLPPEEAYLIGLSRPIQHWNELFRKGVASQLNYKNLGVSNWHDVATELRVDEKEIGKMRQNGHAHRLCFHELKAGKPQVTLLDIKNKLDKLGRKDIFYGHQNHTELPSLPTAIGSLSGSQFEYVLEKIADPLSSDRYVQVDWRNLGGAFGFKACFLDDIEEKGKSNNEKSPARFLIDLLASNGTKVEALVNALGNLKRSDVKEFIKKGLEKDNCWDESCAKVEAKKSNPR